VVRILTTISQNKFALLGEPVNTTLDQFQQRPTMVNAFYSPSKNTISKKVWMIVSSLWKISEKYKNIRLVRLIYFTTLLHYILKNITPNKQINSHSSFTRPPITVNGKLLFSSGLASSTIFVVTSSIFNEICCPLLPEFQTLTFYEVEKNKSALPCRQEVVCSFRLEKNFIVLQHLHFYFFRKASNR